MSEENAGSTRDTKVITVTLNPSLDRTLTTHFLSLGYHNWTRETTRLDPAGRGVNISRALNLLGVPTHAVILVGHDATGRAYQALLSEEQFPITVLRRTGRTRSNIVIKDTGHENETFIGEDVEGVSPDSLSQVIDTLRELIQPGDRVVFAGSLPNGLPTDSYARLIEVAHEAKAHVAINAGGGEPLRESLKARPGMIYLTQTQAEGLFNFPVRTYEDVMYVAQQLSDMGAGKVLVAMTQSDSAVLHARQGVWLVELPSVVPGTSTGQAEAMIAGYLTARLSNRPLREALGMGAAAAAYTGAQVGNEFGTLRDMKVFSEQIDVKSVDDFDELPIPSRDEGSETPGQLSR